MAQVNKVTAIMDKDAIELAIKSIGSRGASLDKDIQLTGLSILKHIDANNEVSLFVKLYKALPKGSRSNALVAWSIAFGKVEVNLDKETKKERPFVCNKGKKTDLVEAAKKPWFDFKKPADPADEFDLDKAFLKFMQLVDAKAKAGKVDPDSALAKTLRSAQATLDVNIGVTEASNDEQGTPELVVVGQ